MNLTKLFTVLIVNILITVPVYATSIDKKDLRFKPEIEALMKGEIHYALEVVTAHKINEKHSDFFYLDSLTFSQEPNVKLAIGKSAYIVNKPAGFFDHETTSNEKFLSHIFGEQKLSKVSEATFKVKVPGKDGYSYLMKTFYDSDEISTLPNSKVIRAVTQAKKLDVISGGASSIVFREFTKFSKYSVGGVIVNSYIPMKENKTLVLTYSVMGVKKYYALPSVLKKSFKEETEAQKALINSFK